MSYGFKALDAEGRVLFSMASPGGLLVQAVSVPPTAGWSETFSFPQITGRQVRAVAISAGGGTPAITVTYPAGVPTVLLSRSAESSGSSNVFIFVI